ncbi:MAG: tRNA 2-selenouridine(34) synthase MnmH [Flavitalea sp.]
MIEQIRIGRTSDLPVEVPLIDVRTPAEFAHGHIPGAFNIPLFSDEERVKVGTTYKQQGKDAAVLLGFDITGSKWSGFIKQALEIAPGKRLAVHCWRGGMRSGAMAWALNFYGFKVSVISGGYKAYRNAVHQSFSQSFKLYVLGGTTGSGKTEVLKELKAKGEQVIDLEELAAHQGSAYGSLNRMKQPTQEQFENNLGEVISKLDISKPVWVEDESINIGNCQVPKPFWSQFAGSQLINLEVDREKRILHLSEVYGKLDKDFLIDRTMRIKKRLGPEQTKFAIAAINENRMDDFIRQVLIYYDKTYNASIAKRNPLDIINFTTNTSDISDKASGVLQIIKDKIQQL